MRENLLRHEGRGRGALVLPVCWQLPVSAVVAGEAVDAGLDQNEAKLGILVATVALEMLAHGDGLLDKHIQVFRDLSGKTCSEDGIRRSALHGKVQTRCVE